MTTRFSYWLVGLLATGTSALGGQWSADPPTVELRRPEATQQVLVTRTDASIRTDMTRRVEYTSLDPHVFRVDAEGLIQPAADGTATLQIRHAQGQLTVPVTVSGLQNPLPVSFQYEIQPLLTKARCNSGGCHGKAEGQNGFKLSLFGFDDAADYEALVKEGRGRRVNLSHPEASLLLQKGAALTPHGGGLKIERASAHYALLHRWIREGAPHESPADHPVVKLEVEPREVMLSPRGTQQLRVTAVDAAGGRHCVTMHADYVSNAPHIVMTTPRGLMEATEVAGEAAILVRYLDQVATCRMILPRPTSSPVELAEKNFIDQHVATKLKQLRIPPSDPIDDGTFLRRASLDIIGTLPTAAEARTFLQDTAPDKRARLVESLLNRPEYADYWAMKWADILRADKVKVTTPGTVGMTRWLRSQFAMNRPFDEFAREILTVQGPIQSESPAAFFKALDTPEVAARSVSQLFLGVRIECAQCHHHPSERWSQDDYAGLVGFFTGVTTKRLPNGTEAVIAKTGQDHKHPRTGEPVAARALGATPADFTSTGDRRQVFATCMTTPENPYFARAIANRLWAHYFGRGLVEPIDDLRVTNPATNEPLLDALVAHLREVRYDLKAFTRTLLASQTYQLSSMPKDGNQDDTQNFSRARPKAMPAEVLLDALSQVTGVPEKFNGWPEGYRSIQVWDNRMPSYFFRIFGRPVRFSVCECERGTDPSIAQALHLMNSPEIADKVRARGGAARRLADSAKPPAAVVDDLFLAALARRPTDAERAKMLEA
ncbi:MAG TPA: DUF1549 domain-containing protein, partial [Planctomycetaceae bacterium]|nr:DUF1549 domain-containing protein [Planctomycetaceae bacterium]